MARVAVHSVEQRTATAIVPDFQLSLAIGKEGQNARLAARLTDYHIDIHSIPRMAKKTGIAFVHYRMTDQMPANPMVWKRTDSHKLKGVSDSL